MRRKLKVEIIVPLSSRRPEDKVEAEHSVTAARASTPPHQSYLRETRKPIVSINGRDVDELPKPTGRAA